MLPFHATDCPNTENGLVLEAVQFNPSVLFAIELDAPILPTPIQYEPFQAV
jgi:hypothetical protein